MKEKSIEKVAVIPKFKQRKRVAAYVRVSVDKETMLHSFTAQATYYKELISKHNDWELVDVYADYGISGTKVNRPELNRMIDDCRHGKIDMIITKSISRFARNTALLLATIRELKALHVDVYFEEQNLNSLSEQGELILTLLASMAEAEAKSVSENVKWGVLKEFKMGNLYGVKHLYGYDVVDKHFVVNEKEAQVVKRIYDLCLKGNGYIRIASILNGENIKSSGNRKWAYSVIAKILKDETYTGKLILQKSYRPIIHFRKINRGEVAKYVVDDAHEPIIDRDTFERVQEEIKRRDGGYSNESKDNVFKQLVHCGTCGGRYQRKKSHSTKNETYKWMCRRYLYAEKNHRCDSIGIPEDILISKTKELLGVETLTYELVESTFKKIIIHKEKSIEYLFRNGEVKVLPWDFKSRSLSWTSKMREEARKRGIKQHERSRND